MNHIYHLLSSNIPHHNRTVLAFFQKELLTTLAETPCFYVVGEPSLATEFPLLKLHLFSSQRALTQAVIAKFNAEPTAWFVLHGQFNVSLWLAMLCGRVPPQRCTWHIWGADLYEESNSLKFRLFYPLRRLVQHKIAQIWATQGDLVYAHQKLKRDHSQDQRLYFPTKLPSHFPKKQTSDRLTILLGNSGDPSNRHLAGLSLIKQHFGENVKVYVPMGYPAQNQTYIHQVQQHAKTLFSQGQVEILANKQPFEAYVDLLSRCDLACFLFERQQGIGTICLLTQLQIPVILHRQNPFCLDMEMAGIDFLYADQISQTRVQQVQQNLSQVDLSQVDFFPPNYMSQWVQCLSQLKG
ncbi:MULTISPECIES: TDP-N-acetylfucosamine:lipid II N-acetylfucosaminyltransferase [Glaesserella]|uniref:TDP-Fuc4NAc--lipid II Fuc4NAc transferase n=1 Tax=Glaesserella australis TaxID=2094024 RepID=A0A328BZI0_9PAST|nr:MULTISPECIES: TDP-N-acetylfucosamine:lipid II N-acetylfucosaminyltransferase [Glaesserella]AUI67021.1 TDP-Fuc4NAc--lipid II Fuc4NAc transferase [Glaesserella sp. 15-184]RAL18887.1 TDP-Fuc4NAc--lipid II Fuc4NAc transferase [Glaesserella australis]